MSSLRTQGPILRGGCFESCCSTALAQQLHPVVMGPCVRRDDVSKYPAGRAVIPLRQKRKNGWPNNVMLPVQTSWQKFSCSHHTQITGISIAVSFPQEGRLAIVANKPGHQGEREGNR